MNSRIRIRLCKIVHDCLQCQLIVDCFKGVDLGGLWGGVGTDQDAMLYNAKDRRKVDRYSDVELEYIIFGGPVDHAQ